MTMWMQQNKRKVGSYSINNNTEHIPSASQLHSTFQALNNPPAAWWRSSRSVSPFYRWGEMESWKRDAAAVGLQCRVLPYPAFGG